MKQMKYVLAELQYVAKIGSALGVLGWDNEVNLPPAGHNYRGEVSSLLAGEVHKRFTAPKFVGALEQLAAPDNHKKLNSDQQIIVRETWHDVQRAVKLPVEFVQEFALVTNHAFAAWVEARTKSDFKIFQPHLEKVVQLCQKEAELLGYEDSPYDALLDEYEPFMTSARLDELLPPLAKDLSGLIKQAASQPKTRLPKMKYDIQKQKDFNHLIAAALGYDFDRGRIDTSPHPFTTGFHPTDVRITTHYEEDNFWRALGATIHETGHALYEQGLPEKYYATPLGSSVSLGVHESQSRIWENFVGRSRSFSHFLYPKMTKTFGKLPYDAEKLYKSLNNVEPSLIRIEADEVTYNLHIVLRYEIEKGLMEGDLKVGDLPAVWNQKMNDYLGVKVPRDADGVLQDVHWSHGSLGYFPTYTLGNLYSAQLYRAIDEAIPNLEDKFASGDFRPFLEWLREHIHRHGQRYTAEELIKRASGAELDSKYLIEHLREKTNLP
jgi:carboxypeptidase Taq